MRLAAAKLPVTTEVIDRTTPPRVGFEGVETVSTGPRIITAGEYAAAVEKADLAAAAAATPAPVEARV